MSPAKKSTAKSSGFGVTEENRSRRFVVTVNDIAVEISEIKPEPTTADGVSSGDEHLDSKVLLTRYLWDRVREPAAAEFNRRLSAAGQAKGKFGAGKTELAPHFGKELCVLAWAVEDATNDPTPVPAMIANWNGLAPEERWWFYTTINAANRRNSGWRKAIKVAFTENPVDQTPSSLLNGPMPAVAPARNPRLTKTGDVEQGQLGLGLEPQESTP